MGTSSRLLGFSLSLLGLGGCGDDLPSRGAWWLVGGAADEEEAPDGRPDTGAPLERVVGSEEEDRSGEVFTLDRVLELELTLSAEAIAALSSSPYTFVEGALLIDGEALDGVGVRIGGKLGSYRGFSGKPGFKIDLDYGDPGRRWRGLERLNVKNMVQDGSFVHDFTAFQVYEAVGIPAPRVGWLWVRVNGEDFGLYSNVEAMDQLFLERRYAEPDGNLYDGDYSLAPDWSSYTFVDFNTSAQDLFDLDEGEDVGRADIHAVTEALDAVARGEGAFGELVGAKVDLDHHTRMMAVEFWAGQYDGYTNNSNNYRVYFDPADGLVRMSPWDHDWAFYDATPLSPALGRISIACWYDADCNAMFRAAVTEVCQTVAGLGLRAQVDRATELVNPYVAADPRKEVSADTAIAYQEALRAWISGRPATLAATYGVDCPAPE